MKYTTQDLLTLVQALNQYGGDNHSVLDRIDSAIAQLSGLLCFDIGEANKAQQEKAFERVPLDREEAIKRMRCLPSEIFLSSSRYVLAPNGWRWDKTEHGEYRWLAPNHLAMPVVSECIQVHDVFPEI